MKSFPENERFSFFLLLLILTTIDIGILIIIKLDLAFWLVGLPLLIVLNSFIAIVFSSTIASLFRSLAEKSVLFRWTLVFLSALVGTILGWGLCLICLIIAKAGIHPILTIFLLIVSVSTMPALCFVFSILSVHITGLENKSAIKASLAGFILSASVISILTIAFRDGFKDLSHMILFSSIVNLLLIPLASWRTSKLMQKEESHLDWNLLLDFFNFLK